MTAKRPRKFKLVVQTFFSKQINGQFQFKTCCSDNFEQTDKWTVSKLVVRTFLSKQMDKWTDVLTSTFIYRCLTREVDSYGILLFLQYFAVGPKI